MNSSARTLHSIVRLFANGRFRFYPWVVMLCFALWDKSSFGQNQTLITRNFASTVKDDPSKNRNQPDVTHFIIHLDDPYSQYIVSGTDPDALKDPMINVKFSIQREVDSEFDEKTRIVTRTYLTSMVAGSVPLSDVVYVSVHKTLDNKVVGLFIEWDKVTWSYW